MPDHNTSLYQQQKAAKPLIEDVIPEYLNGDMQKSALDFAAYLRANKMNPVWAGTNTYAHTWKANYKGKYICSVKIRQHGDKCDDGRPGSLSSWMISPLLTYMETYSEPIMNEGLQNIIWDHLGLCEFCYLCGGGKKLKDEGFPPVGIGDCTVLGREMKGLCNAKPFIRGIFDPDEKTLNGIKRLLELEQRARMEDKK